MSPRDTHGRGLRRPLFPPSSPGYRSRAEIFDDLVLDASERLARLWAKEWGRVDFGVEDVPPSDPSPWEQGVPLGRLFPGEYGAPTRIVLYRRPIEQRVTPEELPGMVRDILAEHVAHHLGRRPDEVDPDYGTGL
jgi:predicted Zn-dependent protease with MMP-like domain